MAIYKSKSGLLHSDRFHSSIGISYSKVKKIVFRITFAKIRFFLYFQIILSTYFLKVSSFSSSSQKVKSFCGEDDNKCKKNSTFVAEVLSYTQKIGEWTDRNTEPNEGLKSTNSPFDWTDIQFSSMNLWTMLLRNWHRHPKWWQPTVT